MVYTAGHRAMAALELLVHLEPATAPDDLVLISLRVPGELIQALAEDDLPRDWQALPAPDSTRALGTAWIESARSLALSVPSVVLPRERNLLLNPAHPDMEYVEIGDEEPFSFDPRLLERIPEAPSP